MKDSESTSAANSFSLKNHPKKITRKKSPKKNGGLPDDTEEGEMASALLGGVGVLVFTCWPVEVEFG